MALSSGSIEKSGRIPVSEQFELIWLFTRLPLNYQQSGPAYSKSPCVAESTMCQPACCLLSILNVMTVLYCPDYLSVVFNAAFHSTAIAYGIRGTR